MPKGNWAGTGGRDAAAVEIPDPNYRGGLIVGVDPGLLGALCLLDPYTREIVQIFDMPTIKRGTTGGGKRNYHDVGGQLLLVQYFKSVGVTLACVEQPGRRPGQNSAHAVTIGYGAGLLHMAFCSEGIRVEDPPANVWKRKMRVPADKWGSIQRADQLFPNDYVRFRGRQGGAADGRAEAAMLALYGAEELLGIKR
jgi:hypothetical protein